MADVWINRRGLEGVQNVKRVCNSSSEFCTVYLVYLPTSEHTDSANLSCVITHFIC